VWKIEKGCVKMVIKRCKCNKITLKTKSEMNGGEGMVVNLEQYRSSDNPSIKISLVDMLFDKEKRNAIYKHFDKDYISTKEEDDICNDMMNYYAREKRND
jgi:hypothetical protein